MSARFVITGLLIIAAAGLVVELKGTLPLAAILTADPQDDPGESSSESAIGENAGRREFMFVNNPDAAFLYDNPDSQTRNASEDEEGSEPTALAEDSEDAKADGDDEARIAAELETDAKEIKEAASGKEVKEFTEFVDGKELLPIALGGESGAGTGGGGGGTGGGGVGGGGRIDLAGVAKVPQVEVPAAIIHIPPTVVIDRTIVRKVPVPAPPAPTSLTPLAVVPVPEPGSALVGFGVAAMIFAASFRRGRSAPVR